MAHPEASRTPQDSTSTPASTPANTPAGSRGDGASLTPRRAWFPPDADDFEITPEAAMYAGRR
jgi:hypothetical protein